MERLTLFRRYPEIKWINPNESIDINEIIKK